MLFIDCMIIVSAWKVSAMPQKPFTIFEKLIVDIVSARLRKDTGIDASRLQIPTISTSNPPIRSRMLTTALTHQ